jgi:hypothetical protein
VDPGSRVVRLAEPAGEEQRRADRLVLRALVSDDLAANLWKRSGMDAAHVRGQNWRQQTRISRRGGDVMCWGRPAAYIAFAALALASGNLGCGTSYTSVIGPPGPTGVGSGSVSRPPSVASIAPRTGSGGSQVTITGTGFTSGETVCFGSASSPDYRVSDSGRQITAVVPPGSGTVRVVVITAAGGLTAGPDDTFTYSSSTAASGATSSGSPVLPCAAVSPETSP